MNEYLLYRDGYKYQITEDFTYVLPETFPALWWEIETDYLWLGEIRKLIMKKGYAWDGPSGPTWDTKNFMRGSLVHDALYQLIREGRLDKKIYRPLADKLLYTMIREDGMNWFRAKYVYYAVRWAANDAARGGVKPVLSAP